MENEHAELDAILPLGTDCCIQFSSHILSGFSSFEEAFEDLKIRNLVKNKHLAKSIHDAGWGNFLTWVKAYGDMHDIPVIAVVPHFTCQICSGCGTKVKKSLSVRTHICPNCGLVMDRDENAAINILKKAVRTVGHMGTRLSTQG